MFVVTGDEFNGCREFESYAEAIAWLISRHRIQPQVVEVRDGYWKARVGALMYNIQRKEEE